MSGRLTGGVAAVMALGLVTGASAQDAASSLTINGTSTVRSWECAVPSFSVAPSPPTGFEEGVLKGERSLETVTLVFPVKAIECGNGTMNDHLRKALDADEHPQIRYRLSKYDLANAESGMLVKAEGELVIAGTARPIEMAVTVTRDASGAIRVRGEEEVKMTDFGVKPPKLMLGTLKVGDAVNVKFDVALRAQQVEVAVMDDNSSDGN